MAKSQSGRSSRRPRNRGAKARAKRSDNMPIHIFSGPENLDCPLDHDIRGERRGRRHRLVLNAGGEPVSSTNLGDLLQNFGPSALRVGAIAGVHTPARHRMKGYSRRVMENSLRWMRQAGYDMTLLFGITGFYPKFGYAPVMPGVRFTLNLADASPFRLTGYKAVAFQDKYLAATLRMYRRNNAGRTGPIVRAPETWRPFRRGLSWGVQAVCKVILDRGSRPVGYFVYDGDDGGAMIIEVGFTSSQLLPTILAFTASLARRRRAEEIRFALPEDCPLMTLCKPLGLVKEVRYRRDGGPMARMINIPNALEKLSAMLAARMTGAGRVTIRTNLDDVSLAWSRGRLRVSAATRTGPQARMPQWALAQMLYGYADAAALAAAGVLKASPQAAAILTDLLPAGPQYYYSVDSF